MARIAILGGSFNPPHLGHVGIARYVMDRDLADGVWVIPCLAHPYAKPLAPFENRMVMCQLAFRGLEHVVVSDVDAALPRPSYTVQTLRYLVKHPYHTFFLIVGSDIIAGIPNWKDSAEIQKLAALIEVPRGPASPIPNVSATSVRDRVAHGIDITDAVPAPVWEYIRSHHLYR